MDELSAGLTADKDLKGTRRGPHIAFCSVDAAAKSSLINELKRFPAFSAAHVVQPARFANVERLSRLNLSQGRQKEPSAAGLRWAEALDLCVYYASCVAPLSGGESPLFVGWSVPCFLAWLRFVPGVDSSLTHLLGHFPTPDFTVYIDVPAGQALSRLHTTDGSGREELSRLLHLLHQNFPAVLERLPRPVLRVRDEEGADTVNVVRENLETFLAQWAGPCAGRDAGSRPDRPRAADIWGGTLAWEFAKSRAGRDASPPRKRAKIVAICGLDGSGKSSLVKLLRDDPRFRRAVCVSKRLKENVNAVVQVCSGVEHAPDDYFRGPFAEAIRWAYAFDFLKFYDEEVLPHLGQDVFIISDRWSACSITYAEAGVGLGDEIHELLRCVPPPDLTIYLDVSPEEAVRRIVARGGQNEYEHMDVLRDCARAYERWWPKLSSPDARAERVINDDLESAYRRAVTLIEQI